MRTSPLKAYAKRPGNSQGLSPIALKDKRARDKAAAMTPLRKKRKRENQANGQSSDYDWHHKPDGNVVKTKKSNNRNVYLHGER
tara:strand:+ start:583 stop:834 length:252 start_codon:yes stop_codon:yes gene_type:complete